MRQWCHTEWKEVDVKRLFATFALTLIAAAGPAAAAEFPLPLPGNDAVGDLVTVTTRYEDTLSDIARAHDLGFLEISEANPGVDPWLPGEGLELILPNQYLLPSGPRKGVVINLAELRLYYYPEGQNRVITHPLGIGREGWATPTGLASIIRKKAHPTWTPPDSIRQEHAEQGDPLPRVVPPGPDNPLGDYALYLSLPGYLLHGTNKPWGVGMRVSHGCIRLYPEDIERLYPRVPVATPVRIINQPYKLGWIDGRLYIEAHQPLSEQRLERGADLALLGSALEQAGATPELEIDWQRLKNAIYAPLGYPVPVTP